VKTRTGCEHRECIAGAVNRVGAGVVIVGSGTGTAGRRRRRRDKIQKVSRRRHGRPAAAAARHARRVLAGWWRRWRDPANAMLVALMSLLMPSGGVRGMP